MGHLRLSISRVVVWTRISLPTCARPRNLGQLTYHIHLGGVPFEPKCEPVSDRQTKLRPSFRDGSQRTRTPQGELARQVLPHGGIREHFEVLGIESIPRSTTLSVPRCQWSRTSPSSCMAQRRGRPQARETPAPRTRRGLWIQAALLCLEHGPFPFVRPLSIPSHPFPPGG
jgi:hypothetical protein